MKFLCLVTLSVLLLGSLSFHSARGEFLRGHHLEDQPRNGLRPPVEARIKAVEKEQLDNSNSGVGFSGRSTKPIVIDEDEVQVKKSTSKRYTASRYVDHLDGTSGRLLDATTKDDSLCPEATSISPCICSVDEDENLNLDCTHVESEEQLAAVFQQEFPVKEFYKFTMDINDKIKEIGNVLNGVSFQVISLEPGPFTFDLISEYFFLDNKDSLTQLTIHSSQISSDTFPFAILSVMNKLEYMHFHGNNLITWLPQILAPVATVVGFDYGLVRTIESGTFPIPAGSLHVGMQFNIISTIEPGSFFFTDADSSASNEPLTVYLYANQLQSLEVETYPLRNGHMTYNFKYNDISSIAPGTFQLPETTDQLAIDLFLDWNQLTTIDEELFGEIWPYVAYFSIDGNDFLCGCDIAWLIVNPDNMAKLGHRSRCENGTYFDELNPDTIETDCRKR